MGLREIYLDNSATTPVFPQVAEVMGRVLREDYGNPSSLHRRGLQAERLVRQAREEVAGLLGVQPETIIFTSGGTEANNLAIKGLAYRQRRRGRHCVTTAVEHASVLNTFKILEEEGFEVTYLPVDAGGRVSPEAVAAALRTDTILVSVMHVNNEIGSIQPLEEIGQVLAPRRGEVIFHADAVQSFGKLPLPPARWGIDMITLSAHKIHGPKGVGALYVRQGLHPTPLFGGGDQEGGLRPGTENVPGIAGFGEACRQVAGEFPGTGKRWEELQDAFLAGLAGRVAYEMNGPAPGEGVPYILNLSFPGLKGEVLVHMLEEKGVYVSTGSACHSRRPEPSHVLLALGLPRSRWESALRVSFSFTTSREEAGEAARVMAAVVEEYRQLL